MQRKSENIEVRFGSQGSKELKRDMKGIAQSMGQLKNAGISMIDSLKIGAGVQLFSSAWNQAIQTLDLTGDQYVDSISRISNVTGTSLEQMSRLAGVARQYGVDIDDLRGSMLQFFGQVAAGARGDSVAEEFNKIGISSQFLAENLDDPLQVLLAVAKAQRSLTGANRAGVLSTLFGEDDSAKVGDLLNDLGSDSARVAQALKDLEASGAIVTAKDVKVTREYNAAMSEISDVFMGLRLELARGILPTISKLTGATADWLRGNRAVVSGAILGGWERIGYAINDVVHYLEGGRAAVRGTWLYPVIGWAEGLGKAAGTTGRILAELFDELAGTRTTREFKWIDGLAAGLKTIGSLSAGAIDAAFAVVGGAAMGSLQLLNELPGAIAFVQDAWAQFAAGFSGTQLGGGLAELGGLFGDLVTYAVGIKDALADIAAGRPVDAQFAWVHSLIDSAPDLIASIRELGSVGDVMRMVGENFDLVAASIVPIGTGAALFVGTFGGIGLAVGAAAVALGVFIARMAEAHAWIKAPFDGVDWIFREFSGMNRAEQEMNDAYKAAAEASYLAWERQRPRTLEVDAAAEAAIAQEAMAAQAPVEIPATFAIEDIEALVAKAQLEVSGAVAMSQFPGQITAATTAADTAVRRAGQAVPTTEPRGIPIIIQLQPGGQETTVYAESEEVVQQLLDQYANARRASATPGGLPFAGARK